MTMDLEVGLRQCIVSCLEFHRLVGMPVLERAGSSPSKQGKDIDRENNVLENKTDDVQTVVLEAKSVAESALETSKGCQMGALTEDVRLVKEDMKQISNQVNGIQDEMA
ncbi:unnamed protein product [Symbiodinium natans]|uniref:Uncharacterized protein n=1 Tax=Symbiodinium natans TaxID=878477 RepID=A0A812N6C6_9DINO|nr:unnamed protein product [Symbiodinium natans]